MTNSKPNAADLSNQRTSILIDSDANNELDDQHAIAYATFNSGVFNLTGVTVNNTPLGNGIQGQYDEAKRVLQLCDVFDRIPLFKGAEKNYEEIKDTLTNSNYDGKQAVDFIVSQAREPRDTKLTLIPIGKLTNIALALDVAPDIQENIRVVWLGSNYPNPGEYNLKADVPSLTRVLESEVSFEMVTVRYVLPTGSAAVAVSTDDIKRKMPGLGPAVPAVEGRHGGSFSHFGDYSISLFSEMDFPRRPLFDVVAVAVVKNPNWGKRVSIPAPRMENDEWIEQEDSPREISIWENFDKDAILNDFFESMTHYELPEPIA